MHDMQGMVYSFPIPHIMMNAWLLRLAGSLMLYVLQSCMLYYSPANVSIVYFLFHMPKLTCTCYIMYVCIYLD